MLNFEIPIIAIVSCDTIDEARAQVEEYISLIKKKAPNSLIKLEEADDSETDNYNNRMVFLHPEDTDAEYDPDEYNRDLDEDNEDDRE